MSLLDKASLIVTPNGFKASKLYSVIPSDGSGDLDVTRATTATRVNSLGLIESVAVNVPRIDYTNESCPSLLVEPQSTNLALYSEQFDNAGWLKGTKVVSANSVISPDGTTNADILFEAAIPTSQNISSNNLISFSSGTSYTITIFAKNNTSGRGFIQIPCFALGSGGSNIYANFNLINGTVGSLSGGTSKIESLTNNWYKCSFSFVCGNTIVERINYSLITSATSNVFESYTGDVTKGICIWGAQCEVGGYATSYIPTVASSVTRNVDVISKTGISSLIGQTEGTIFVDFGVVRKQSGNSDLFVILNSSNSALGAYVLFMDNNGNLGLFSLPSSFFSLLSGTDYSNNRLKIALAYNATILTIYVNGTQLLNTTLTGPANMSALYLGANNSPANFMNGTLNSAQLYKSKLSNTELAQLTTI